MSGTPQHHVKIVELSLPAGDVGLISPCFIVRQSKTWLSNMNYTIPRSMR
jgi:hypothetical protein